VKFAHKPDANAEQRQVNRKNTIMIMAVIIKKVNLHAWLIVRKSKFQENIFKKKLGVMLVTRIFLRPGQKRYSKEPNRIMNVNWRNHGIVYI
jgi:hypothetical protein